MPTANIPEGERPYTDLVREAEPYLDTAPRGPYMINAARNAVRRVCKDLNILQKRVLFDKNEEGNTYVLDHAGYDFCQLLGIYAEGEAPENRLDQSNYVDVEVGVDTTTWTFTLQNRFAVDKLLVRYSMRPTVDSKSFPYLVWGQYSELLRLALLADIMPYVHEKNKRVPRRDYMAEYMSLLNDEKYRTEKGWGPEEIGMFTAGQADYRY